MNKARQFGKTTTAFRLKNFLEEKQYFVIETSFEGISDTMFDNQKNFSQEFLKIIGQELQFTDPELSKYYLENSKKMTDFNDLSQFITQDNLKHNQKVVLIIDEVDKSSNNQLFLGFLGMLRNKYLLRNKEEDVTFQSVILIGLHDVKTIKLKIRPNAERQFNSPWNIAIDFRVDMTFNSEEIETILEDYMQNTGIQMNQKKIAEKIYYYTNGYPYLVSKICKNIDEEIILEREEKNWILEDVEESFNMITDESYTTTLFDSLFKNLENNKDLFNTIYDIVIKGKSYPFTIAEPIINFANMYSIITKDENNKCKIHNRIFEQKIYDYMIAKYMIKKSTNGESTIENYFADDELNLKEILRKFLEFMKENYSDKDDRFLEREGRLIFLSFLKPILNGKGHVFKEPNIGNERRMDLVITYNNKKYVLELKIWYDNKRHQKGLQQLSDYLDLYSITEGYLLIFNFNKNKKPREEEIDFKGKRMFAVWI